ncbi:hypothetical protein CASFOL_036588 [Castilleja foliolosa]|uniref:Replication protein A 70 kDa DNA-binding subunit B/D first OB fold domain-containing protein n=1 Tax=Castilleja foliolosa TaxID=1961234 RepID=A0ABD3BX45_9LAMI
MGDNGKSLLASRPVKEVTRTQRPSLKLRVVRRFYRGVSTTKKSLEIVFHDLEGGRITGAVKSMHLKNYDSRFIQGRVYAIRTNTYKVESNSGKFLTAPHKCKIVINEVTSVHDMPQESFFSDFMFNFRSFSTLQDPNNVDLTELFDVIGKVVEIHAAQEREIDYKVVRLIEIVLEDLSYKVGLSTSFDTTQIHSLETLPAILEFKTHLEKIDVDHAKSISRGSLTSFRVEYDDLTNGKITCSSVETIFAVDEPSTFWVCAIIGSIVGDWSYLACPKCNKKMEPVEKLIGRPCQELRQEYIENLKSDKTDLPTHLNKLVDQTILFKVKVERKNLHKENAFFQVTRLVTDTSIVSKYTQFTAEAESEADFYMLMLNEDMNFGGRMSTHVKTVFDTKKDGDRSCTNKTLDFGEEGVGSSTTKFDRHPSMTKKQYMRKFVVQDDDEDIIMKLTPKVAKKRL